MTADNYPQHPAKFSVDGNLGYEIGEVDYFTDELWHLLRNARDGLFHTPGHVRQEGVAECCPGCLIEADIDKSLGSWDA